MNVKRTVDAYRTQLTDHTKHSITYSAAQDSSTLKQPQHVLLQSQTVTERTETALFPLTPHYLQPSFSTVFPHIRRPHSGFPILS